MIQTSLLARYSRTIALGPDDHALPVITRRSDHSPHPQWCEVVGVAVHRRNGTWTHVYSCLLTPAARPIVLLVRVMEGEQIDEAVDWIIAQSGRPGVLFARPPKSQRNPRISSAVQNGVVVENGRAEGVDPLHPSDQTGILKPIVIEAEGRQPSDINPAERHGDGPISLAGARLEMVADTKSQ